MMRKLMIFVLILFMGCLVAFKTTASRKDILKVPQDFKIVAMAGGRAPGTTVSRVEIDAEGNAVLSKGVFEEKERFRVADPAMRRIYGEILENDFFGLESKYQDDRVLDGSFAELTVTCDGKTHTVRTTNTKVERFDNVMIAVNLATPGMDKVVYNAILE